MSAFEELASVDGRITATAEATIGLKDDGLYRGDGAFEVIRLYAGAPFALADHVDRLERSTAAIALEFDRPALESEIEALLARAGLVDGQLRLIVTRGGRRIAATEPVPPHTATVSVATIPYSTSGLLDRVKSLSYGANMHATRLAKAAGADEALLITADGTVLEPPTSTVFWATPEGALRTPSLELPILDSITRDRLVETLEVEEGVWNVDELRGASEAFLASTTREVQPISAVDNLDLPTAPGPRTLEAQEAFKAVLERELGLS
jgi:branched-chain amino acid aminotransferase